MNLMDCLFGNIFTTAGRGSLNSSSLNWVVYFIFVLANPTRRCIFKVSLIIRLLLAEALISFVEKHLEC